jgi:hypothetical protein
LKKKRKIEKKHKEEARRKKRGSRKKGRKRERKKEREKERKKEREKRNTKKEQRILLCSFFCVLSDESNKRAGLKGRDSKEMNWNEWKTSNN